jgi:hypothetical protein
MRSAYLGLGLPAVLAGLISLILAPIDASAYIAGLAAAIVVAALPVVLRTVGTAFAPQPPGTPSDSWCSPRPTEHHPTLR